MTLMSNSMIATATTGTAVSVVGTALQTSDIMQWISLAITIIGAIVSFIVIPIMNYRKEKGENKDNDTDTDTDKDKNKDKED